MGLFASLNLAANSLEVIQQSIGVIQNNVTNASTPGYVQQNPTLLAAAFNPNADVVGGVRFGPVQSTRNQFAESAVRNQNALLGTATSAASSLNSLQQDFSVSGTSGIPAALSGLFSAFSAWATTPSDSTAQQAVITAAQQVAQEFNNTAGAISQVAATATQQVQNTVSQINSLTAQIQQVNVQIRNGDKGDAGLDAQLNNDLESLANFVGIDVHYQSDGTVNVLLGGQTPLVIGTTQNQLNVTPFVPANPTNADAPPTLTITLDDGTDVTNMVTQGQLAGLLTFSNTTLPSVQGDSSQAGGMNQLAQALATAVNNLVTPASGIPLFTTTGGATNAAASLAVNANMTSAQLVASSAGASNGTADALAQLGAPNYTDATLGFGYTDFYSNMASSIGQQESTATANQTTQQGLLSQAQNVRSQLSGVSLDQAASQLIQFQSAYSASAQTVVVINNMLTALVQMTQNI